MVAQVADGPDAVSGCQSIEQIRPDMLGCLDMVGTAFDFWHGVTEIPGGGANASAGKVR